MTRQKLQFANQNNPQKAPAEFFYSTPYLKALSLADWRGIGPATKRVAGEFLLRCKREQWPVYAVATRAPNVVCFGSMAEVSPQYWFHLLSDSAHDLSVTANIVEEYDELWLNVQDDSYPEAYAVRHQVEHALIDAGSEPISLTPRQLARRI